MDRVAALIVNYNMPERAEALYRAIATYVDWPVDVYLIDNGSDLVDPAEHTNVFVPENVQTTKGWLAGLHEANKSGEDYLGYWFVITSAQYVADYDILAPMAQMLIDDSEAVVVHPALTLDSTTIWDHMYDRGSGKPRRVWYADQIAVLYRADFYNRIGGFDPALSYAHGIGLEACWKARRAGKSIWIHEACRIKKVTDIGYTMNRMNMTADQRRANAKRNMDDVLGERYGPNYWYFLRNDGVDESWR